MINEYAIAVMCIRSLRNSYFFSSANSIADLTKLKPTKICCWIIYI